MKNLTKCLFLLMLLFVFDVVKVQSQTTLIIEDFEESTCSQENDACEVDYLDPNDWTIGRLIDDNSCLLGWRTSHGTPSVVGRPYEGNKSLSLEYSYKPPNDTTKLATDGAFVDFDFEEDSCYAIIFWYQFDALYPPAFPPVGAIGDVLINSDFKVALANGLTYDSPMEVSPCYEEVPVPTSKQEVFSIGSQEMYEYAPWRKAQFIVTAEQDFEHLWFYFNDGPIVFEDGQDVGNIDFGRVDIDSVVIRKVDCDFPCECETLTAKIGAKDMETSIQDDTGFNGTIPAGCYEVAGTLLIDETTTATGATFIMQPGSQIVVESPNTFKSLGSEYESCIHMWKGIKVETGGTLKFASNQIFDAEYAIELLNGSSLWMIDNLFDRNYIGVYAYHKSPFPGNITQSKPMDNNEFTCSGLLLTPYDGQTPDPGIESLTGIRVSNINHFNIGVSNNANIVNIFHDMRTGILAWRSNMDIHYCDISDINGFEVDINGPASEMSGVGFFLDDCNFARVTNNDFTDQNSGFFGIVTDRTNGIIRDNVTEDLQNEIRCRDFSGDISGNELERGDGIWVSDSHNKNISITGNDIFVELGGAWDNGILIENCINSVGGDFNIENNTIETRGVYQRGIFLQSSEYVKVKENTISQPINQVTRAVGIDISGCRNLQIRDDTISGAPSLLADHYIGIKTFNSTDVLYCCNKLDNSEIGMHFDGMCDGATIATTQFWDHDTCLVYTASAVTDKQGSGSPSFSNGNSWNIDDDEEFDAFHYGGIGGASLSPYYVWTDEGADDIDPGNWFTFLTGTPDLNTCENWVDCGEEEWLTPVITSLDSTIVKYGLDSLEFSEVVTWLAKKQLYKNLVENPSLYSGNTLMEDFKDSTATSEIGRLFDVEIALLDALIMSDSLDSLVNEKYDSIAVFMNELDSLNGLLVGASVADSTRINLEKDTIIGKLQIVTNNYNEEIDSFRTHRLVRLSIVESVNDTTSVSSHPATNEQEVNELEINYWVGDFIVEAADIADLYDIAKECPLVGGNAVFRARSLHDVITLERINWDSLANCASEYSGARLKNPEEKQVQSMLIYPNPTDGSFTIEVLQKEYIPANVRLFDINGRVVRDVKTDGNPINLDGSYLPQGIYTIKMQLESGAILTGRIVITHL